MMFGKLDHIAIVVESCDEALRFYRDVLGFPVVADEVLNEPPSRLVQLKIANDVELQLVEPLTADHPLKTFLQEHGEALHHICFQVDGVEKWVESAAGVGLRPRDPLPHSGTRGRKAAFIDPETTRHILIEVTGA